MQAASLFFFFQAEDGIRGGHVTGVQTCALPISYFFDNLQDQSVNISTLLERTVKAVPAPPVRTQLVQVPDEQVQAEQLQQQTERLERLQRQQQPQEMVRVASELLEGLVNLAGETSINRGRVEQGINEFATYVDEMGNTVARLYEQLRRLDVETEAQILSNYQQGVEQGKYQEDGFDPLEMDQYSELNQITRQLSESASDLLDLKSTLVDKIRDTETLLLQRAVLTRSCRKNSCRRAWCLLLAWCLVCVVLCVRFPQSWVSRYI